MKFADCKIGQRVRLTGWPETKVRRAGTIWSLLLANGHRRTTPSIRVLRDGIKTVETWSPSFWEPIETPTPPKA
jgi:hypothetical protein